MTPTTPSSSLRNGVTQDAMASFSKATDPRLAHVMSLLAQITLITTPYLVCVQV